MCGERKKNMLHSKMVQTVQVRSMDIRRATVEFVRKKGKTYATFKKGDNHVCQEC
jgi:hypothetical protein